MKDKMKNRFFDQSLSDIDKMSEEVSNFGQEYYSNKHDVVNTVPSNIHEVKNGQCQ